MIKQQRIPWFTILIAVAAVSMFCCYWYFSPYETTKIDVFEKLGAPAALEIYQGQYWGVFINSFVHNRISLLIMNVIAVILLGAYIERRTNFYTLFILGFIGSVTTSLVQLNISGDPGIGLTGVNFFLTSYIVGRSINDEPFKIRHTLIIKLLLLSTLIAANILNIILKENYGIESMISGILFGFIIGLCVGARLKRWSYAFSLIIILGLGSTLFYAPWSVQWNLFKAYEAHISEDYTNAKHYYFEALQITPHCPPAIENLRLIKIDEMSDNAYSVHESGDYLRARILYEEILLLDPKNEWAKDQLKRLP